jgi:hypothetical protein
MLDHGCIMTDSEDCLASGLNATNLQVKRRSNMRRHRKHLLMPALSLGLACAAPADIVYQTNSPFGSPFGLIGFDVFSQQSVAVRFTPAANHRLDRVSFWFMNNDDSGGHPTVTLSLRNDDTASGSIPGQTILEAWQFNVSAVGWDPQLEQVISTVRPLLLANRNYWLVAESAAPPGWNGVWNWASTGTGMMSICNGTNCSWSPASSGAVVSVVVEGTPVNAADINGDGVVNVNDLLAVINAWGACPPPSASCPADIAPPPNGDGVVNVNDLLMVINNWG